MSRLRDEYPFLYLVIQADRAPHVCTDPCGAKLLLDAGVEVWDIDGLRRSTYGRVTEDIEEIARLVEWRASQSKSSAREKP